MNPSTTFIYGLVDPRSPEVIRYVGKANDVEERLRRHLRMGKRGFRHNNKLLKWIEELLAAELKPSIVVLEEVCFDDWQQCEKRWIVKMREANPDLLNLSSGGDGLAVARKESREAQRIIQSEVWNRPGVRELRRKQLRDAWAKPENKKKLSDRGKARWLDQAYRERLLLALAESRTKPEWKQKMHDGMIRAWADPVIREARCAAMRAGWVRKKARLAQTA